MSLFKKAEAKQAKLKVSLYGPPGAGKTFTTLLMAEGLAKKEGKKIAFVDTENGSHFYSQAVKERKVHPKAFSFDALYTKSLSEILEAVESLDSKVYGVVVIDSISHCWDSAIQAYEGTMTKADTIPLSAWGKIKKPYKRLMNFLIGAPMHVFILGRQKNVFEDDPAGGGVRKVGVGMRAEGESNHETHICLRMEYKPTSKDQTRGVNLLFVEKDRTGVLQGQSYNSPDFSTIEPLLPLLGSEQVAQEDEDERIAKDSELLKEEEQKSKDKESKSKGIFVTLQAGIASAAGLDDLGAVRGEIQKKKRYLVMPHLNALRELYSSRRDEVMEREAKSL